MRTADPLSHETQECKIPSRVELLPFDVDRDLPLLRNWLDHPHVASWWGDVDQALAFVSEHQESCHARIAADDHVVGYLCWQNPSSSELETAGLTGLPVDLVDVDILIGEPDFVGRGVGPTALRLLADHLQAQGVSCVGLAADTDNRRALRAYRKAGFQPFHWFEEEGRRMCYLVRYFD